MKNPKKAFTLLETMIVMGVVVLVLGSTIIGINSLRQGVELNSEYTNATTAIRQLRSDAINAKTDSVFMGGAPNVPDAYAFTVENPSSYSLSLCACDASISSCSCSKPNGDQVLNSGIEIAASSTACNQVLFLRSTADALTISVTSGACTYTITNTETGSTREFTVDLDNDSIQLQ